MGDFPMMDKISHLRQLAEAWRALAEARAEMLRSIPGAVPYETAVNKAEKANADLRRLGAIP
jgi:hypothetical protein